MIGQESTDGRNYWLLKQVSCGSCRVPFEQGRRKLTVPRTSYTKAVVPNSALQLPSVYDLLVIGKCETVGASDTKVV